MKKLNNSLVALILLAALMPGAKLKAQFKEGSTAINVGVGFLSSIGYGSGYSRTPAFLASGEYGIAKAGPGIIGGGLALGFQSASYTGNDGIYYYKERYTTFLLGIRGTYHPDILNTDKYDVYGVIQLSYVHFGYNYSSNSPYSGFYNFGGGLGSFVRPYILVGGRYYFSKTIGVFAELGYDISFTKLGLAIKL